MYDNLLSMLYALKFASADVHYKVKGESFWGNHEFADQIREDLDDYIDSINEVCYLGSEQNAPYSKDIITKCLLSIPPKEDDGNKLFFNLLELVKGILVEIERVMPNTSAGEANLLGNIAESLQKRYGLLWRHTR